ncbi:helix-turn-helix domain-containing protein [Sphingomonas sp. SUN039]|uniref:winged helix-turn-helix transcriptional regulator n=1 Tax=Sphingomonas sp. SUN039 TaxID=2937787 RepID=UPI0021641539|nr:helix-turn-helix domain-containing protein [Sphingomonas sp. SUN039]UVO54345.1 helix-turn-helix transcriptional regulator [Sphingomonas sp. SUN039]
MIDLGGIDGALHHGLAALAEDMRAHGHYPDDPARHVFALLGDRWTTLILFALAIGTFRHAELRRAIARLSSEGRISQRVLTAKLRVLERDGFVSRHATADVPPKVSYALTASGHDLVGQARRLLDWVHSRRGDIDHARTTFDDAQARD